jgi:hypothetical protein
MNKLIVAIGVVALACLGQGAWADDDDDDDRNGKGKVSICHKGRTVSINESGLSGHLRHGDSMGSCEDRRAAVVMMQCVAETDGDGIVVSAVEASDLVDPAVLPSVEPPTGCATALADLLDANLALDSVTSGSNGTTDYLLRGYVAGSTSP